MIADDQTKFTLQQVWEMALGQLQLQMTRATFDTWVKDTSLISVEAGDEYVIETKNAYAKDWLEHRLLNPIQRTLTNIVGTNVSLKFVINPLEKSPTEGETTAVFPDQPVTSNDLRFQAQSDLSVTRFVEQVDFEHLWMKSGFTQVPDYAIRYWRIYLGRAFDLWEFLISEDKRDVKKMLQKKLPYWTPPKRYSYRSLASVLGCGRPTLTGRLVPCWVYEGRKKQAKELGEVLPEATCCGKYRPCDMRHAKRGHGEFECLHWLEGILERLYREGLVAVERVQSPGKPRAHALRLQAWRLVPLLTPFQVARFKHELDRERHKHWIERYGHLSNFDLGRWEQISAPSLVEHVPGYEWGRELFDNYQNNPLLDMRVDQA